MRNPFLNTQKYAIVRDYHQLQSRSRSKSNSSYSSVGSGISQKAYRKQGDCYKNSIIQPQNQYNPSGYRHYLEQTNVRVNGIEQLRYKPSYYDILNPTEQQPFEDNKSKQKINPSKRRSSCHSYQYQQYQDALQSSLTSINETCSNRNLKEYTEKMLNSTDQIIEVQDSPRKRVESIQRNLEQLETMKKPINKSNFNAQKKRRKSSILETMINLDMGRNFNDYRSSFNLDQSSDPSSSQRLVVVSKKKINQNEGSVQQRRSTFGQSSQTYFSTSKNCISRNYSQISNTQNIEKTQPLSILVRGKLYFRFQTHNR